MLFLKGVFQSVSPKPAAATAASPGKLLAMEISGLHSRSTKLKTLGGLSSLGFNKPSR